MPTGNYTFTQTLYKVAQRTAMSLGTNRAALPNSLNVEGGPTGLTQAKGEFADMVNRHMKDILADVSSLNAKTATLTVAAGASTVAIPDDLFRSRIQEITYAGPQTYVSKYPIRFIGKVSARSLDPMVQNGTIQTMVPVYVSYDESEENFIFYPAMSQQTTFNIKYSYEPTLFTGSDFDNASSTTVAPIPDDFDDLLPTMMAIEMARIMRQNALANEMAAEFYDGKPGIRLSRLETAKRAMDDIPALMSRARLSFSNTPTAALADDPLTGQYFGGRPGLRN